MASPDRDERVDPQDTETPHEVERRCVLTGALALMLAPLGSTAAVEPRNARPQPGDTLVYSEGARKGETVVASDIQQGAAPVFAYPKDPSTGTVRDGVRINLVLVVRPDPKSISEKMAPLSTDGVVAYSAVCTHYGCQVTLMHPNQRAVVCNCHGSTFDVGNSGEIIGGPATRRLAVLPIKSAEGVLTVAAGFIGRLGPPQQ